MPIGNLTSQLFANYYLTALDRYIKEELKVKGYLRYMGDGILFDNDKFKLHEIQNSVANLCEKRRIQLHRKKTQIAPVKNGIRFLGFHLHTYHRSILRTNLKRFKRKFKQRCKQYGQEEIQFDNLLMSLNAWLGYVGKNRNFSCKVDRVTHKVFVVYIYGKSYE